jgi:hypothetical protein
MFDLSVLLAYSRLEPSPLPVKFSPKSPSISSFSSVKFVLTTDDQRRGISSHHEAHSEAALLGVFSFSANNTDATDLFSNRLDINEDEEFEEKNEAEEEEEEEEEEKEEGEEVEKVRIEPNDVFGFALFVSDSRIPSARRLWTCIFVGFSVCWVLFSLA